LNKLIRFLVSATLLALLLPTAAFSAAGDEVILGGVPFGLTMYTSGVIVINVDDSDDSPAHEAGIRENDIITRANGEEITSNEQLKAIVEESRGEDIALSLYRGESPISLRITPRPDDDGSYVVGMWIRDSTAGLGTITYFDESTRSFGALGHGVNDRDTGVLLPLRSGRVVGAEITSVTKAQSGIAGGLNGTMTDEPIGEITVNTAYGVFGRYESLPAHERIACADEDEIRLGEATISCTLDDTGVHSYDVVIERLNLDDNSGQNMVVRVTDPDLLAITGGIVQGMSGSPIIQNGKLIGAVTHVFVNSPETGYGISIGNMRGCYARQSAVAY
jgi:stage IV sporulation protein B